MTKSEQDILPDLEITEKNKIFCREYIFDWNGSRAYKVAYSKVTDDTARVNASKLLTNTNIKSYIEEIQKELEKVAGISQLRVLNEHIKLAFSSIAHLHNTWISRKEFETLTEDQKSTIAEIDTKIKYEYEFNPKSKEKEPIKVEYIKIKLYDKQKSLDSISKMLGYDAPTKIGLDVTIPSLPTVIIKRRNNGD